MLVPMDLVVLAADKNMQSAIKGALARPVALRIRPITFDFRVHPGRDGGVRTSGIDVLRRERHRFGHAILVLDFEGSGARAGQTSIELEADLDSKLAAIWGNDAKAVVIDPELEAWVWGSDNALSSALSWPLGQSIRPWLSDRGFAFNGVGKPERPKEAFEALVAVHKLPRSSAIYEGITSQISLAACKDAAFGRLRDSLRTWFPKPSAK